MQETRETKKSYVVAELRGDRRPRPKSEVHQLCTWSSECPQHATKVLSKPSIVSVRLPVVKVSTPSQRTQNRSDCIYSSPARSHSARTTQRPPQNLKKLSESIIFTIHYLPTQSTQRLPPLLKSSVPQLPQLLPRSSPPPSPML